MVNIAAAKAATAKMPFILMHTVRTWSISVSKEGAESTHWNAPRS